MDGDLAATMGRTVNPVPVAIARESNLPSISEQFDPQVRPFIPALLHTLPRTSRLALPVVFAPRLLHKP